MEKGAITQAQADAKFNEWKQAKDAKIANVKSNADAAKRDTAKARMDAERKHNEAKAEVVAAKRKAAAEAEAAAKAEAEAAEAAAETTEAPAAEATEAPAAE